MEELVEKNSQEIMEKANPLLDPLDPQKKGEIVITEKEKENFFKCFLSDRTYEETMSFFKDKWKITIRALTVEENDAVLRQIALDQKFNVATTADSYLILILQYRLSIAIRAINGVPFQPEINAEQVPFDVEKGNSYVKERIKAFANWPMYKLSIATEAFRTFEQKIQKLAMEVANENFWGAVE